MNKEEIVVTEEIITAKIYLIRGLKVMIDSVILPKK